MAVTLIVQGKLNILVVGETKSDETFTEMQFVIKGFERPYILDRNKHGGGIIIYVREDIPSSLNKIFPKI